MAAYTATIDWTLRPGEDFVAGRYSRLHSIAFDGGITIPGSASPSVVPLPWSSAEAWIRRRCSWRPSATATC